jgi:peptide/nickel transport system substrate-binding protein
MNWLQERRSSSARRTLVVAVLAAGSTLAFLGSSVHATPSHQSASRAAAAGGTLVVGRNGIDVNFLDPIQSVATQNIERASLLYDTLTTVGANLNIQPSLATSWKQLSRKEWVFNIRQGVRFSNGREMTVNDVIGSIKRLVDPKNASPWAPRIGALSSITASGPWQVKITTETPNPALPAVLAHPAASIVAIKEIGAGTFDPTKQAIGTGPFTVSSHVPNESWTYVRNPHYWNKGLPVPASVEIKIIPSDTALLAALRSGAVDMAVFDNPATVGLLHGIPNIKTYVEGTTDVRYVALNSTSSSIFSDVRLRRAVALAIDRSQYVRTALAGVGKPTAAISSAFGVCDPSKMPFAKPNLQEARNLVAAAGAKGKSVDIVSGTFDNVNAPLTQLLQQEVNSIGLKANIIQADIGETVKRLFSGGADFDLYTGWIIGNADPSSILSLWNPAQIGFTKAWGPPDETLNRLILRSQIVSNGPKRTTNMVAACERIAQDAQIIPIATRASIIAYNSSRVAPKFPSAEPYGFALRFIDQYKPLK